MDKDLEKFNEFMKSFSGGGLVNNEKARLFLLWKIKNAVEGIEYSIDQYIEHEQRFSR